MLQCRKTQTNQTKHTTYRRLSLRILTFELYLHVTGCFRIVSTEKSFLQERVSFMCIIRRCHRVVVQYISYLHVTGCFRIAPREKSFLQELVNFTCIIRRWHRVVVQYSSYLHVTGCFRIASREKNLSSRTRELYVYYTTLASCSSTI